MQLPAIVIFLYSLLLVCGSSSVDDGAIDLLLDGSAEQPRRPVTPPSSTVEHPENDAEPATVKSVNSEGVVAGGPTVSAVALPTTGNGKRTDRAAEILKTNENQPQQKQQQQPASFSSSSVLPNPLETITLPSQSSTVSTSLATTSADHIHLEMTSTTTTMTPISTSIETNRPLFATSAAPPEETLQPDDMANVTTSTTTPSGHQISVGNEEYVADDGGFPSPTTDAGTDDEETTAITADKSTPALVGDPESDDGHRQNVSSSLADPITTTETLAASQQFSGSPPVVVAVGRALSQEESVPWPEAKSTKVIGTIIEDLHGPFSDGVSSVSTTSPDVLTGSGIAAIVMCTFLVFLTTAGASGYWLYRRRFLLNRPETLSERYAPSETGLGAGEDIFRVGYVHSPEMPRQDSSEEMYSLDNDSFLTSLEAMTIPTYWTETIKHTKL